jgi:hypothetical protein
LKTIIFCPAYCLKMNGKKLTRMNYDCTIKSLELAQANPEVSVVFSTAYVEYWREEARQKLLIASKMNIDKNRIKIIPAVTDTYTEIKALEKLINLESVIIHAVLDYYHAPRALKTLHYHFPNTEIIDHKIKCKKYMRTLEPSYIKSIRTGNKVLWILWNQLANIVK